MADEYIIELKKITKRFPGIVANSDISLNIKKGEIFALLGENGAGKSTLMSMLFGMYEPDEGEIIIRGKSERIVSPRYATELNIGMVHQHFKLVSNFTIAENIILGGEPVVGKFRFLSRVDLKKANKHIEDLSEQYGLAVDPSQIIEKINVSTQQRVEILKMLYRNAEILIFDEPTAVLTPQEIEFLLRIIKNLREQGKTIILISHKLDEIKKVADRCAVLRKGELIDVMSVKDTSMNEMANKMVGREVLFDIEKNEKNFGEIVLDVQNVTVKNDNHFEIVKDVSFKVRKGEIFAIAGVAGNGQVEIADAIIGLLPLAGGSISVNGKQIDQLKIRDRYREGISYIPEDRQNYGLLLDFSLRDNLIMKSYYCAPFASKGIIDYQEADEYGRRLIEEYDIRSANGTKTVVRSMSGGNQQKAIVAREIEQNSELMIFVQPTRGLDVGAIEGIHRQILEERDKRKAILLISLELDEVMQLADTIGVIYNGKFQKVEDAKQLTTQEVGAFMMGAGLDE